MQINKPRGAILLYVLLIAGVITTAAFAASDALLVGIKSASSFGRAAAGRALIDAGAEDALYHLRKAGSMPNGHEKMFINGVEVQRSVTYGEARHAFILAPNESYDFGIYDPLLPPGAGGVEALQFSWDDDCGGASTLDMRWLDWSPGQIIDWDAKKGVTKNKLPHAFSPAIFKDFSAAKTYRVRLLSLACTQTVTVDAYADDALATPGKIQTVTVVLSATTFGGLSQSLEVKTLRAEDLPVKN